MPPVEHKILEVKELLGNYPNFKWFGSCKCGFQTRMSNEALVKSQLDNHLMYHGESAFFAGGGSLDKKEKDVISNEEKQKVNENTLTNQTDQTNSVTINNGLKTPLGLR